MQIVNTGCLKNYYVGGQIDYTVDCLVEKSRLMTACRFLSLIWTKQETQFYHLPKRQPWNCDYDLILRGFVWDGALAGLQNGGINVQDLGELQSEPKKFCTRIEWYNGDGNL